MTLEESLRALATDDDVQVPPHVDAAVMAAWDASRSGHRRAGIAPGHIRSRRPWFAVCAALIVAVVVAVTWRTTSGDGTVPRNVATPASLIHEELVLVPELEAGAPLTLMRVRMSRREFSRLGVAISNPDGDGLVDVEVLVGEDGVARSIRRAVAVARTAPNP